MVILVKVRASVFGYLNHPDSNDRDQENLEIQPVNTLH